MEKELDRFIRRRLLTIEQTIRLCVSRPFFVSSTQDNFSDREYEISETLCYWIGVDS
jgi:hypothetical protein